MAPNPRRLDERLQAIYDRLPEIACQGLCYDSCGPISLSLRERVRMEKAAGHPLGTNGMTCNMLSEGRCTVHPLRPMICRMWGVVESMPCIYGCEPEGGKLVPDDEAAALLAESLSVGGPLSHSDAELVRLLGELRAEDPANFKRSIEQAFREANVRPTLEGR